MILRRDAVYIHSGLDVMPSHVLFKDEPLLWPVCQETGVFLIGRHPASNSPVADHIKPHRGDPELFWNPLNLHAVSKTYHDSAKQRLERAAQF